MRINLDELTKSKVLRIGSGLLRYKVSLCYYYYYYYYYYYNYYYFVSYCLKLPDGQESNNEGTVIEVTA